MRVFACLTSLFGSLLCGGCLARYGLILFVAQAVSPTEGAHYRAEFNRDSFGQGQTNVTKRTLAGEATRMIPGLEARCLAISPNGEVVALGGYMPAAGSGRRSSVVLVLSSSTLETISHWAIPGMNTTSRVHGEVPRFEAMAMSPDAQTVATYCWNPVVAAGNPVVALWRTRSGEPLGEFESPEPNGPRQGTVQTDRTISLAFSADGKQLAAARMASAKAGGGAPSSGIIHVWQIEDGHRTDMPLGPDQGARDLCFDESGTRLAYWCWIGSGTSTAWTFVRSLPDGRILAEELAPGRIWGIRRSPSGFEALLGNDTWLRIGSADH